MRTVTRDDLLQEAWGDVLTAPADFVPLDERARAPYARTCDGCALYQEQRRREQTLEAVRAIWRRQTEEAAHG